MALLVALVFPLVILVFTGISAVHPFGTSGISNPGPHEAYADAVRLCFRGRE